MFQWLRLQKFMFSRCRRVDVADIPEVSQGPVQGILDRAWDTTLVVLTKHVCKTDELKREARWSSGSGFIKARSLYFSV